jgi:hypothetical protein
VQLQRRNAAHLRLCSKAEESHATLLPRRECACHSRESGNPVRRDGSIVTPKIYDSTGYWMPAYAGMTVQTRTPKLLAALTCPRHEGDGAPKSANLWLRDPCRTTAGTFRRATCAESACLFAATCRTGRPRFRQRCPASDPRTVSSPSPFLRSKSASGEVIAGVWLGP